MLEFNEQELTEISEGNGGGMGANGSHATQY